MTSALAPQIDIDAKGCDMDRLEHLASMRILLIGHDPFITVNDANGTFVQHRFGMVVDVTEAESFRRSGGQMIHILGKLVPFTMVLIKAETIGPRLIATWYVEIG